MANIYARLGDGNRALECIEILTRSSTGSNLLTYHNDWRNMGLSLSGWGAVPPFQIDANFGVTAAVLEMLVFSKLGLLKLLPALPDKWTIGQARGIACREGRWFFWGSLQPQGLHPLKGRFFIFAPKMGAGNPFRGLHPGLHRCRPAGAKHLIPNSR